MRTNSEHSVGQTRTKMDVGNYLRKFKLLFENVLEGKSVINDYNMESLLKFLKDRSKNSPGQLILKSSGFHEVILQFIENMDDASDSFKVLLIKVVTILYENGENAHFTKTQMPCFQNLFNRIYILDNLKRYISHKLHLACIKLAIAQLNSELECILRNQVWKYIFYPTIHHKPRDISNAAYDFMAKLVWKLNNNNLDTDLQEVLGHIVGPILSSEYFNVPVLDAESDSAIADEIFPHLSALLAVMAEGDNHVLHTNKVRALLKEYFLIDHRLFTIFNTTKNSHLLKLLNTCLFRYILMLQQHLLFSNKAEDFCNKVTAFHRNLIGQAVKKRDALIIVDFVTQSTVIWSNFEKFHASKLNLPVTFERNGEKLEFSLQIVVHLMMPMVKYFVLHRRDKKLLITDEIDLHIRKMAKSLADYIFSSCYVFGTLLEEDVSNLRRKVTNYTLKELLRLKGHLSQTQAGPLFQSLFYLLQVFIACDGPDVVVNQSLMDIEDLTILSNVLNAMKMLLKEYKIPWYENLEVVCVQSSLLNLLKQSILTVQHIVQILDLINICIMKFLSPNMSLLVESRNTQDNTLDEIGKVIKLYVQHEDWEVRDAALNILNTCIEISFIKYIPLQKVISNNNLIILAAKAGLTDPECYSQSTALKCLAAATKIDSIWQEVLADNSNICLNLIYMLKHQGEDMVRREAVNVLAAIYANQRTTPTFQNNLYEVMLSAALDDLNWEVQLAALNFWRGAIQNHLTYRGMLDGKFPAVTFSKEKRKIIVLNDAEIRRQLTAILNHLSNIGCLTVLLECMDETQHIEVISQANCIANEILEMLDNYNFSKIGEQIGNVKMETVDESIKHKLEFKEMVLYSAISEEERNMVIESILSVDQVELITNLYDNNHQTKSEEMEIDISYNPRRELVDPNTFLEHVRSKDYTSIIKYRKECDAPFVCTLDQLLDEILDV